MEATYRKQLVLGPMLLGLVYLTQACTSGDQQLPEFDSSTKDAISSTTAQPEQPSTSIVGQGQTTASSADEPMEVIEAEGIYSVAKVEPAHVQLVWRDTQGQPLGQLEKARRQVEATGVVVLAVLNAGIYTQSQSPAGLHIENSVELVPINLNDGEGNFQLLPNGVFYIDKDQAHVTESNAFENLRQEQGLAPSLAVQSGPQLVIDGQIHPEFSPTSESLNLRNGVGVTADGELFFLNANERVSLWDFAKEFQDRGAVNALYLDGAISRMEPALPARPMPFNMPFAGMLVITE